MSNQWRDRLAGARMQVDQQFNDRIIASQFTNQQWGLIMTAVEFDIVDPEDPDEAELVAKTDNIKHIIPELDNIPNGMSAPGGGTQRGANKSSGSLLGKIKGLVTGDTSGGGGADRETIEAANALTSEYAAELQAFLEDQGRWNSLCESAAKGKQQD